MNKFTYRSVFAPYIYEFLKWKEQLGHKAKSFDRILLLFDMYCFNLEVEPAIITEELYKNWVASMCNNSVKTINNKCTVIKQFSMYLTNNGQHSYIPRHLKKEKNGYIPYIYSPDQMSLLFHNVDKMTSYNNRNDSYVFAMPTLVRTIYALGLRLHEATSLNNSDIDIDKGTVLIRMSKNGQQRILPMSTSLKMVIATYIQMRNKLPVNNVCDDEAPFFISPNGKRVEDSSIYYLFRKLLDTCGIEHVGNKRGPHIHHLRHTFAVHTLDKQVKSGVDLTCTLPYLMTFLGHKTLSGTEVYVRTTEDMLSTVFENIEDSVEQIFIENEK